MMMLYVKLLCFVAVNAVLVLSDNINDRTIVESPSGKYRGHVMKSRSGRDILAFQGIPYALPPVGNLRLKDPIKIQRLDGIYEANDESRECYQPTANFAQIKNISSYKGSEDCLYLNVYKPDIDDNSEPMPVLFWIHGGGFLVGSGSTFWNGPKYLLDKDMIMVTVNYRLQTLGFLSNGDKILPGNLGMKDIITALKWVQENIESFGGDPNSVTVGGASAGGVSASYLMHSPLSTGLFHRVIAESGTAYGSFATKTWKQAKSDAKQIADFLGCSSDSEQMLKCLQKMPLEQIYEASVSFIKTDIAMKMDFLPVFEEEDESAFITKKHLNVPSKIPMLAGVTSNEYMFIIREMVGASSLYNGSISKFLEDSETIIPIWGYYNGHPDEKEITGKIMKFYFGDGGVKDATEIKLCDIFSDLMMNHGLHLAGKKEKGPTYLYKFSYRGVMPFPGAVPPEGLEDGVSHVEEFMYLFDTMYFQRHDNWPEEDLNMSYQLVDMWYNFIRNGNPTPNSKIWEESNGGIKYLDITNHGLHMKSNMFKARMEFLDTLPLDPTSSSLHDEL